MKHSAAIYCALSAAFSTTAQQSTPSFTDSAPGGSWRSSQLLNDSTPQPSFASGQSSVVSGLPQAAQPFTYSTPQPPQSALYSPESEPSSQLLNDSTIQQVSSPLTWGLAHLHPHVTYRLSYGDGLQSRPGSQSKTVIQEVMPGATIRIGDHWTLDYTPHLSFYSSKDFRDTLDHTVGLSGGTTYNDWSFGLSQRYASSSQPMVETGSQTETESYTTGLSASRILNSKLSLDLGLSQNLRYVQEDQSASFSQSLSDSKDWSTSDWLNYKISNGITAGLGATLGYSTMAIGSDMLFEQLNIRGTWVVVEKLSFVASVGLEDRQFLDSDASDAINPLFNISARYQLFEHTGLSLTASRAVQASYFANQITESTRMSAGLTQRLFGKLNLGLSGGVNNSSYVASTRGIDVNREDTGTFFSASLGLPLLNNHADASVFYHFSENSSNSGEFSYDSTQVGFELTYRF